MSRLSRRTFLAAAALVPFPRVAGAGAWDPPAVVVALASGRPGRYDPAPPWGGAAGCARALTPTAANLAEALRVRFPRVPIQGLACRPNTANAAQMSVHGVGRALDVMVGGDDDTANWLLANSAALGVQLIIWRRRVWRVGGGIRAYGGPNPHTDHVHVEVHAGPGGGRGPGGGLPGVHLVALRNAEPRGAARLPGGASQGGASVPP